MTSTLRAMFALMVLTILAGEQAHAVPAVINYQAVLQTNGPPIDGSVDIAFRIYEDSILGTAVWAETLQVAPDSNGRFSVLLGQTHPLGENVFTGSDRWLAVEVANDGEMSGRQLLTGTPYSFRVATVDSASGGTVVGNLKLADISGIERIELISDPGGPVLSIRDPGGSLIRQTGVSTTHYGDDGVTAKTRLSASGLVLFGAGETDTSVTIDNSGNVTALGQAVFGRNNIVAASSLGKSSAVAMAGGIGLVAGDDNNLTGSNSSAIGDSNTVSGDNALAIGTINSISNVDCAAIGRDNDIQSPASFAVGTGNAVDGGGDNICLGDSHRLNGGNAAILGGNADSIFSSPNTVIVGGQSNVAARSGWGVIGGGKLNRLGDSTADVHYMTISGGFTNSANGPYATVGGGATNRSLAYATTVAGGAGNIALGSYGVISGGDNCRAYGVASIVPGGSSCNAIGDFTLAAGRRAKANHSGTLVWADNTDADFTSTGSNQFLVRAGGGVGINTTSPASALQVNGPIATAVTTIVSDVTLNGSHSVVLVNSSPVTVTLPAANSCPGRELVVKKVDAAGSTVTVSPAGGNTIDGSASYGLASQYNYVRIVSDGSNWIVVGNN